MHIRNPKNDETERILRLPGPQSTGASRLFTRAIVRIPGSNFADGLTTVDLGVPHFDGVLHQHARYCDALSRMRLSTHHS